MLNEFSRSELLLQKKGIEKLKASTVAVFGIGGVGSFAVEALARTGIGTIVIVDDDCICLTNINRQLIATRKTIGHAKVDIMKARIQEINPEAIVISHRSFFNAESAKDFDFESYDYIIDAIDTISSKLLLVELANNKDIPIISCMGAGNKLDPTRFEVADIFKTSICPLARVMRSELRKRGIPSLKVVYSREPPLTPLDNDENSCKKNCICPPGTVRKCSDRRAVPGSVSFVPSVAGLILAGEVIKDIALSKL